MINSDHIIAVLDSPRHAAYSQYREMMGVAGAVREVHGVDLDSLFEWTNREGTDHVVQTIEKVGRLIAADRDGDEDAQQALVIDLLTDYSSTWSVAFTLGVAAARLHDGRSVLGEA